MSPQTPKFFHRRAVKVTVEILLILLVYLTVKTFMQRHLVEGIAPVLQDRSLTGQTINLQSFKGQPVLVQFWATWCPVCKLEQNSIDAISRDHTVITVAMSSGNKAQVKAYMDANKLSFPVVLDEDGAIARRFGVRGTPTGFVIDRDGNIAFSEVGYTTGWGLRLRLWLAGIW
jgi:peroxiredoxin